MLEKPMARLRYAAGNCLRLLDSPWRQFIISQEEATNIFGCSFGGSGWHHIRRTLNEYDHADSISSLESSLGKYLQRFCPTSISILAGVFDEEPLPLFIYPWGSFSDGSIETDKKPMSSRFCGPSSIDFIEDEFQRTINLYKEMKISGYQPLRYPNSFVGGTWLESISGDRRFVVMQGNHRMAILSHLKYSNIAVRISKSSIAFIREKNMNQWPMVKNGRCSVEHAKKVFDMFFQQNGHHISRLIMD